MHIKKLKVRKVKAGYQTPCAVETLAMLSCWAASKNGSNVQACAESAKALSECMRANTMSGKKSSSTINFHLARLQKIKVLPLMYHISYTVLKCSTT
ncbi:37s ribosomal mitochondrial [Pyrrhoderma noxium]|uniref:37s ribosomal mitochondrial n=1 Tax=Pyrrhoderma noxium TaxID=2282107 RepID=A0A286UUD9_9AGAM|nr:37s ribosomal mitochondrial [Pyrrhoderma noxium]